MDDELDSLFTLHIYKDERYRWVFDDGEKGIVQEPFVAGMDRVIDYLVADIPHAYETGRYLHFDEYLGPLTRPHATLVHSTALIHPILGQSNYFIWEERGERVWMCNTLYRYIDHTPQVLCLWTTAIDKSTRNHSL